MYIPSSVTWDAAGVTLEQEGDWPGEYYKINMKQIAGKTAKPFDMKLRVPWWATKDFDIKLNGTSIAESFTPSTYVTINNVSLADEVEVICPFGTSIDYAPDKSGSNWAGVFFYGPLSVSSLSSTWSVVDVESNLSNIVQNGATNLTDTASRPGNNRNVYSLTVADTENGAQPTANATNMRTSWYNVGNRPTNGLMHYFKINLLNEGGGREPLYAALLAAKGHKAADYTPASFAALQDAFSTALPIYQDEASAQFQIEEQDSLLKAGIDQLVPAESTFGKEDLLSRINAAKEEQDKQNAWDALPDGDINKTPQTKPWAPHGYARMLEKLAEAQNVYDNSGFTLGEINAAHDALKEAMDTMRLGYMPEVEDLAPLTALIEEAKAIASTDYSVSSFAALQEAITVAEAEEGYVVNGSSTINWLTIPDAMEALQLAIDSLGYLNPVTGVTLERSMLPMAIGGSATLTATVLPVDATNSNVVFSSSDPEVVTVDAASGEVTAVGLGRAIITVSTVDGGKTATCEVTVTSKTPEEAAEEAEAAAKAAQEAAEAAQAAAEAAQAAAEEARAEAEAAKAEAEAVKADINAAAGAAAAAVAKAEAAEARAIEAEIKAAVADAKAEAAQATVNALQASVISTAAAAAAADAKAAAAQTAAAAADAKAAAAAAAAAAADAKAEAAESKSEAADEKAAAAAIAAAEAKAKAEAAQTAADQAKAAAEAAAAKAEARAIEAEIKAATADAKAEAAKATADALQALVAQNAAAAAAANAKAEAAQTAAAAAEANAVSAIAAAAAANAKSEAAESKSAAADEKAAAAAIAAAEAKAKAEAAQTAADQAKAAADAAALKATAAQTAADNALTLAQSATTAAAAAQTAASVADAKAAAADVKAAAAQAAASAADAKAAAADAKAEAAQASATTATTMAAAADAKAAAAQAKADAAEAKAIIAQEKADKAAADAQKAIEDAKNAAEDAKKAADAAAQAAADAKKAIDDAAAARKIADQAAIDAKKAAEERDAARLALAKAQAAEKQNKIAMTVMGRAIKINSAKNSKKGRIVVSLKKDSLAAGYQVQWATNSSFRKAIKKDTGKVSYTIKSLKKKTYYVRARAYAKDSKGKTVYGQWSKPKKVKVTK